MKRTALIAVLTLVVAGCSPSDTAATTPTAHATTTTNQPATSVAPETTTTTIDDGFPVIVVDDLGEVTIEARPTSIVSISATATEMLFAVRAGEQVVAVDDQSDYPDEAPMTDLSGFTPNLEAILSFEPDLVVLSFDPGDVVAGLETLDIPTLMLGAAFTIDDTYRQIEVIGTATGHRDEARKLNASIEEDLAEIVGDTGGVGENVTYYHELDATLFSVTSASFIGQIYGLLGMENIADAADPDGEGFGYPQLSSEYIVTADPQVIYLADAVFGESAETLVERPGWDGMSSLASGAVVELDDDISSRWGPRIVDFLRVIAESLS